jgi:hypothetical protein
VYYRIGRDVLATRPASPAAFYDAFKRRVLALEGLTIGAAFHDVATDLSREIYVPPPPRPRRPVIESFFEPRPPDSSTVPGWESLAAIQQRVGSLGGQHR